jgi:hypothetical protein
MPQTQRVAHALEKPSSELDEFPAQFKFRRRESRETTERHPTGLLTGHPNMNCDTLAAAPGAGEQQRQRWPTNMVWNEVDLTRQRVEILKRLPTEGDGARVFDDTGFAKQGKTPVGAARQYSGALGKVGNCQGAVKDAHRRGRPRRDFSPSARPAPNAIASPRQGADRRRKLAIRESIIRQGPSLLI